MPILRVPARCRDLKLLFGFELKILDAIGANCSNSLINSNVNQPTRAGELPRESETRRQGRSSNGSPFQNESIMTLRVVSNIDCSLTKHYHIP